MRTFNMYVKTIITNDQGNILLLKQKRDDNKQRWDLPGSTFTEEQSFDETVITKVQKEIGYYVYPGKIIGVGDYTSKKTKEVHVIMEGNVLNGELLLSKDYETYAWVKIDRIREYPLAPWLHEYVHNTKEPFKDVITEIEDQQNSRRSKREIFQEDVSEEERKETGFGKSESGIKSSFSILKDTIIRTFHPKQAHVSQTTPKTSELYQEPDIIPENNSIEEKLNIRHKKDEPDEEYIEEALLKSSEDDIIIEHDPSDLPDEEVADIQVEHEESASERGDIIIDHGSDDIIIDHEDDEIIIDENTADITTDEKTEDIVSGSGDIIVEHDNKDKNERKVFDMNVNKDNNTLREPEIKIIRKEDETPLIRKEKESKERISFSSENFRTGWKERLNRINRTEANNEKKEAPRPKGRR